MKFEISFLTLLKIALFVLLCVVVIKIWPIIIMIVVASLIAVMLDPLIEWLVRHGLRRGVGIGIVTIVLFGLLTVFLFVVVPITVSQMRQLGGELPRLVAEMTRRMPAVQPYIAPVAQMAKNPPHGPELQQWLIRGMIAGRLAVAALFALTLTIVIAIYLLIEGRRALEWLIVFAHEPNRTKLHKTVEQVRPIVFAYMRGQAIDCTLCGAMSLTTLMLLHIPAAVPLAVLAVVADIVPVIGTVVMIVPAVLFAMLVSPVKAIIVLVVYLAYHLVESYFIIPRVFGRQMRLSNLTVLLTVTIAFPLLGALGAMLTLPFVAAYPVVEEIWLKRRLGDTVVEHERLEER
jgi:predicted PurR-regulated permease PerM